MTASPPTPADDARQALPQPDAAPGSVPGDPDPTRSDRAAGTEPGQPREPGEPCEIAVPPCPRLPLALLAPHPGNKREDLDLNDEFVASIREDGIRDPIEIVPLAVGPDGTPGTVGPDDGPRPLFTIIDGHRRYFGAQMASAEDVPVYLAADRDGDLPGQYLDMFTSSRHTTRLKPIEEANALFAAHQAGATQTAIRKKTGLRKEEVRAAIKAGVLDRETRLKAEARSDYALTIDQYALLTEFQDDDAAVDAILRDISTGGSGQHAAERIRQQRAQKTAADRSRERYTAEGYQVADGLPDGARYLRALLHDGGDLTPETHASCPGRGIAIRDWNPEGDQFCSAPDAHGHIDRYAAETTGSAGTDGGGPEPGPRPEPDGPGRRLVREGNLAWTAAGKVRRDFLADLCGRATVSRDAHLFAAKQILAMPPTVAAKLPGARHEDLFRQLAGGTSPDRLDSWRPGRLPLVQLALVIASYESLLASDAGKACWRETRERRFPPVTREDTGAYLAAVASLGYQLSTIEQAIADGVPYTGEPGLDEPSSEAGAPDATGDGPAPEAEATA